LTAWLSAWWWEDHRADFCFGKYKRTETMNMLLMAAAATLLTVGETKIEMPNAEAGAFFSSRKVERGMVENPDPVFGWEVEVEWYGFHGGFEACYDMTDINGRGGRYNELATTVGYEYAPFSWLNVGAEYIYKHEWEGHTQEIEFSAEFPLSWLVPYATWNVDADECAGALYGVLGIYREWEWKYGFSLMTEVGFGYGNKKRNMEDFECGRCAARDVHANLELSWEFHEGFEIVPFVGFYDQFTKDGRSAFDNGFFVVAGVSVKVGF